MDDFVCVGGNGEEGVELNEQVFDWIGSLQLAGHATYLSFLLLYFTFLFFFFHICAVKLSIKRFRIQIGVLIVRADRKCDDEIMSDEFVSSVGTVPFFCNQQ